MEEIVDKTNQPCTSAFKYLWRGIQVVGGLLMWCVAATVIGLIICLAALFISAFINPDLSKAMAKNIMVWAFWISVVFCAIATAYLAWNAEPEEEEDDAEPQR